MTIRNGLKIFFSLIFLVFPLGQLLRWQISFWPEVKLQPLEFLLLTFSFLCFWEKIRKKEKFFAPLFFKEMVIFGGCFGFSLLLKFPFTPFKEFLVGFFYLLRIWNFLFFYWALNEYLKKVKIPIFYLLFYQGVVIAVLSIFQYLFFPDTRFLLYLGWDDHYYRAIGSFLDPAFTGLFLVLSFFVWVFLLKENKKKSLPFWGGGFLILSAVALTFARLDYFLLIVGLLIFAILEKRIRFVPLFSFVLGLIIFLLPKPGGEGVNLLRTSSFVARWENYQNTLRIIKKNWLFGVGFNLFRYAQRDENLIKPGRWQTVNLWQKSNAASGADNSFLFVWATAGILGLVSFGSWWFKMIKKSWEARKERQGSLILVSLIIIFLSSLFVNSLFYPWVLVWVGILLTQITARN